MSEYEHIEVSEHVVAPSLALAALVGPGPMLFEEVRQRVWRYIDRVGLRPPGPWSHIRPDSILAAITGPAAFSARRLDEHLQRHVVDL
jgi:chromatin remodeling complex protein RSC6